MKHPKLRFAIWIALVLLLGVLAVLAGSPGEHQDIGVAMRDAVLQTVDLALDIFEGERFDRLPEIEAIEDQVDYMAEHYVQNHVERLMRDAKITQIYEGTSEIQKIVLSKGLFK